MKKEKDFKIGRSNFALTIFAPKDCGNHCPFCTSKQDYIDNPPNFDAIVESIKKIHDHQIYFHDIIITGGEPLADYQMLNDLLEIVDEYLDYTNLYINTTLPEVFPFTNHSCFDPIWYINNLPYITGVNISRHINTQFKDVVPIEYFQHFTKPVHINCVLDDENNKVWESDILHFVNKYIGKVNKIVFREDYRKTTPDTLHSLNNPYVKKLDELYGYKGSTSCNVCNTDIFGARGDITLHRGLEYSSIEFANFIEINDLIIRQDGLICYDWSRDRIATDNILDSISTYQSLHRPVNQNKQVASSHEEKIVNTESADRICQICRHYNGSHNKCTSKTCSIKKLSKRSFCSYDLIKDDDPYHSSSCGSYDHPC